MAFDLEPCQYCNFDHAPAHILETENERLKKALARAERETRQLRREAFEIAGRRARDEEDEVWE